MQKNKITLLILFIVIVGCAIWVRPTITSKDNTHEFVKTKFTAKMGDEECPIYITCSGSCFINKKSKAGGTYKYTLKSETSKTICKELDIAYKPEKR